MTKTRSAVKKVLFGVLSVTLALSLSLAVAEGVLRTLDNPLLRHNLTMARIMHYKDRQGMVLSPGVTVSYRLPTGEAEHEIRINPQGLRMDRPVSQEPLPGVARILALGDSMTFGLGVDADRTYPAQLERILQEEDPDHPHEVINAGFASGICPLPQHLYLKDRGLRLGPSRVLVGFFPANDLMDMWKYTERTDPQGDIVGADVPGQKVPHAIKRTALYQYFGIMRLQDFLRNLPRKKQTVADEPAPAGEKPGELDRVARVFRAMRDFAERHDIKLTLLYIPDYARLFGSEKETPDPVHDAFPRFCETERIDCVDLTPVLREAGPDCYFPKDRHFTEKGHRVVAEAVAGHIVSGGRHEPAASGAGS
jgi:lysophospholipase L1-like esterase